MEITQLEELAREYNKLAQRMDEIERQVEKGIGRIENFGKIEGGLTGESLDTHGTTHNLNNKSSLQSDESARKLAYLSLQFPQKPHFMLRLALGASAPFQLRPLSKRLQYKKEYEEFQFKSTLITLLMQTAALVSGWNLLAIPTFLMLIYTYYTAILRQHILVANGSRIRSWWILHHYLGVVMLFIFLIWQSNSTHHQQAIHDANLFGMFLGVVRYLQYRYQQQRLKTLIALEDARPLDTIGGASVISPIESGTVLIPFLVACQVWQMYISYCMCINYVRGPKEWNLLAVGMLFGVTGIGNIVCTLQAIIEKRKIDRAKEE